MSKYQQRGWVRIILNYRKAVFTGLTLKVIRRWGYKTNSRSFIRWCKVFLCGLLMTMTLF